MNHTVNVTQENIERGNSNEPDHGQLARPFRRTVGSMRRLPALLCCLLALAAVALAQEQPKAAAPAGPSGPISPLTRLGFGFIKGTLIRSAEKMPEEHYGFKPTWVMRSFGQVIGHVAESNYYFCSRALGEKNPAPNIAKTKTSKAELIGALNDAFSYCDKAMNSITEASANQMVKFEGLELRRVDMLTANLLHTVEHYGNLVVYMRMKNIVPPSTETEFTPPPTAKK